MDLLNKVLLMPKPAPLVEIESKCRSYYHFARYLLTKNQLKKNAELKNLHNGQRCFVICTGNSVANFDFSMLKDQWVIACNLFYRHPAAANLKYAGYFELDPPGSYLRNPDPFWRDGGYHRELANFTNQQNCPVFLPLGIRGYCSRVNAKFNDPYYLQSSGRLEVAKALHNDLSDRFNMMDGVVYAMLGAAAYLGFKELFLLGSGYTYQPIWHGHFYDNVDEKTESAVDSRHKKVKMFLDKRGIKIWNVTPDGFRSPIYNQISESEVKKLLTK